MRTVETCGRCPVTRRHTHSKWLDRVYRAYRKVLAAIAKVAFLHRPKRHEYAPDDIYTRKPE